MREIVQSEDVGSYAVRVIRSASGRGQIYIVEAVDTRGSVVLGCGAYTSRQVAADIADQYRACFEKHCGDLALVKKELD